MKSICAVLGILAVVLLGSGYAEAAALPGEQVFVVDVDVPELGAVQVLADAGYTIASRRGLSLEIYATASELAALEQAGYEYRATGQQVVGGPSRWSRTVPGKALGTYHSYATMTAALWGFEAAYPDICRLETLGLSTLGRELWALCITDNPDVEENEPEFKYVSTMHGDEPVGTELCLYLIDHLLANYGSDQDITDLVDSTEIWIVPLMNPDGLEAGTRYNAQGYDLNRTFPHYGIDFDGAIYDGAPLSTMGRPPEVAAVMAWTMENSFVLSANLHTGSLLVNYPYDEDGLGAVDSPTPDDALFEVISLRYSQENPPMYASTLFDYGITNGAAWYTVYGGMQDWNYRYVSCNEVTIELSNTKRPAESALPGLWEDNREAMLAYMTSVHMGLRGVVTDKATGQPVWAQVMVQGNTHPVFTDADVGDFHRMLLPGPYTLEVRAPGYVTRRLRGLQAAEPAPSIPVALAASDVNNDGSVDADDVQYVINAALSGDLDTMADLDSDAAVAATDVQLIINTVFF